MQNQQTILLHSITPDQLKEMIVTDLKIEIEKLLKIQKETKPIEYLTQKQVAEILKVTTVTINDWGKKGILNPFRIGNKVRYKSNELERALTKMNTHSNKYD